ncbi:putative fimbrial adhesin [Enterobacter soli]|uniref:pilus protein n=1 Tax=Enterobacter soli TaxID=885040 RepID=UPI000223C50A|nr:pilus protein [Enterobacter soli]AEN62957.1 putative fimbrial adhesin [Enterobacter soli]OAT41445.1 hypothetical protein M987_01368 [Enterobacter soli ATCC BAA-2102]
MKLLLIFVTFVIGLFSTSTWAVDCYQNNHGGAALVNTTITPFTVPENTPVGKKVWESGDITVTVYCDNSSYDPNNPDHIRHENIYAYILDSFHNTDGSLTNNPYLAFGVTYNGVDYDIPDTNFNTGACVDSHNDETGTTNATDCNGSSFVEHVQFSVRFRLYVKLKKLPPQQHEEYTFPPITVLTFDGAGGINTLQGAKNLHYTIDGLTNIDFLDCSVNIKIYPENQTVDFGSVLIGAIASQPSRATFSISALKDTEADCTEKFDVTTSFYTTDTLYDDTHLDMGNGLLMRINDQTGNYDIQYNQYQDFATYAPGTPDTVTHDYIAELTKNPGKDVVEGPFSKDLVIKVNYQ